ncbi:LysM peptidoglycan-binding domain-containing protein [Rhodococcus sp. IEGM 1379]|uniref:LysM peptidoglycan-binding domain-containing protein n=1 Tax=Rhodococcus sp. IEGM 1379 TaxID=3047086 RepID=UPI0024B852DA|nr:LysM peptidoglycan-binding domain-containing protein [Rhodococcus sp. IEGM 1379]MDI9916303.1 LysM peptidoglycan-binding domain-containing protein [Rhodococcus sp. IEGM 1379]
MSTLQSGQSLGVGQELKSDNGSYALTLQDDGNLVLSENGQAVWAAGTNGSGGNRADVQADGNFVIYKDADAVWASQTSGNEGASLSVQDDRNVVLSAGGRVLWSTDTAVAAPVTEPTPEPAAAPEPEPAPAAPAAQTYTVEGGDTLWAIAERFYGDGNQYQRIADANGISNPDLINAGQVLTIPA